MLEGVIILKIGGDFACPDIRIDSIGPAGSACNLVNRLPARQARAVPPTGYEVPIHFFLMSPGIGVAIESMGGGDGFVRVPGPSRGPAAHVIR